MKKSLKLLIFLSAAALCLGITQVSTLMSPFPDLEPGSETSQAVEFWAAKGVISGFEDGFFRPEETLSRAQVAKLISVIFALPDGEGQYFSDVAQDHWASAYIRAAVNREILLGYGDGTFHPDSPITRQEAFTLLYRLSTFPEAENDLPEALADRDETAGWALPSTASLWEQGIIPAREDGLLLPLEDITRGDFALMLYRLETASAWGDLNGFFLSQPVWRWDGGLRLPSQNLNGKRILILPAGADLTQLDLYFGEGTENAAFTFRGDRGEATGLPLDLQGVAGPDEEGIYSVTASASLGSEQDTLEFQVMASQGVSSIFLSSSDPVNFGREFVDREKGNSVTGQMKMLGADGSLLYDGDLKQIKSRGNSTFSYPKKAYQIKLDKKSDLLGNGEKVKTWVLLANYGDATMFRDKLCKDLAMDFGLPGTPECAWTDLFYDGEYRGTYLLSEKVQISSTGLDITDLEGMYEDVNPEYGDYEDVKAAENDNGTSFQYVTGINDPEDYSQGYLLETSYYGADENSWFMPRNTWYMNVKAPENLSYNAMKYLSETFDRMYESVYGGDWRPYLDEDSFARMYLIYLFSDNRDAYEYSTYYYLENGIFYAGPIWDGDQTFGLEWENVYPATHEFDGNCPIIDGLLRDKDFRNRVVSLYNSQFRELALACAGEKIPAYVDLLSASEKANHLVWQNYYLVAGLSESYDSSVDYRAICEKTAQWILDRVEYMDGKFENWSATALTADSFSPVDEADGSLSPVDE